MALVVSQSEIRRLLPMTTCIDLMAGALERLALGGCMNPLRWGMRLPEGRGLIGMMPAYLDSPRTMGLKVVAVMPGNHGTPYDSHQGVVLLFDVDYGFPPGADLVCTTTSSPEPVLFGEWLAPGAHVNAVGSSIASARELDTAAVVKSRRVVDRRESTVSEAGDFLFPKHEGAIDDGHIVGEVGEILLGRCAGRRDDGEVTLFKSLGLAVEDLAAAHHVYTRANEEGSCPEVRIGDLPGV